MVAPLPPPPCIPSYLTAYFSCVLYLPEALLTFPTQQGFLRSRAHILRRSVQDPVCAPCRVSCLSCSSCSSSPSPSKTAYAPAWAHTASAPCIWHTVSPPVACPRLSFIETSILPEQERSEQLKFLLRIAYVEQSHMG
jgi:hypothetical protein